MNIEELEDWYRNAPAPEMPVFLNDATKVTDYALFVNSHFEGLRNARFDSIKAPLLARLQAMKLLIEANL